MQVNYSEKCTLKGLKGWSLNTGGLKDRFDRTCMWLNGLDAALMIKRSRV